MHKSSKEFFSLIKEKKLNGRLNTVTVKFHSLSLFKLSLFTVHLLGQFHSSSFSISLKTEVRSSSFRYSYWIRKIGKF